MQQCAATINYQLSAVNYQFSSLLTVERCTLLQFRSSRIALSAPRFQVMAISFRGSLSIKPHIVLFPMMVGMLVFLRSTMAN
jgi:hypothetical protein